MNEPEAEIAEETRVYTGYTRTDGDSGDVTIMEKYVYDGVRLVSATTQEGTMTLTYDESSKTATTSIGNLLEYKMTWDEKGNIVKDYQRYESGYEVSYVYSFDDEGRPLSSYGVEGEKQTNKVEFTYDKNGNKLTEVYYTEDGLNTVNTKWEYDDKGNLVKKTTLDGEESYTNTYDEKGNMVRSDNADGSFYEFTYDDEGRVLTRSYTNSAGRFSNRREYTYYPSGELHTESYYGSNGDLDYTYTHNYTVVKLTLSEARTAKQMIEIFIKDL